MAQFKETPDGRITIYDTNDRPRLILATDGTLRTRDAANDADGSIGGSASLPDFGPGVLGPIGDRSHVPAVTVDAKGRFSALTSVAIVTGDIAFTHTGVATVAAGSTRYPIYANVTIAGVVAMAGTAPTGAALLFDVNKNGTTVFTTQANRPTIADGVHATSSAAVPDVTALAAGDYLSVDIDQVGSTASGSDIVVVIHYV